MQAPFSPKPRSYRHALLRNPGSVSSCSEKDVPAPPVVSRVFSSGRGHMGEDDTIVHRSPLPGPLANAFSGSDSNSVDDSASIALSHAKLKAFIEEVNEIVRDARAATEDSLPEGSQRLTDAARGDHAPESSTSSSGAVPAEEADRRGEQSPQGENLVLGASAENPAPAQRLQSPDHAHSLTTSLPVPTTGGHDGDTKDAKVEERTGGMTHGTDAPHEGHNPDSEMQEMPHDEFYDAFHGSHATAQGASEDSLPSNVREGSCPLTPQPQEAPHDPLPDTVHEGHAGAGNVQPSSQERSADEDAGEGGNQGSQPTTAASPDDYGGLFTLGGDDSEDEGSSGRKSSSGVLQENSGKSLSDKLDILDLKKTTVYLRDLLKYPKWPEPTLTKLPTRRRGRRSAQQTAGAEGDTQTLIRQLTGNSAASRDTIHTVEQKFKQACVRLEDLLQEAMVVANEAADHEANRRKEAMRNIPHGCYKFVARTATRQHEPQAALGAHESSAYQPVKSYDDSASLMSSHVPPTPRDDVPHDGDGPHRCLLPGFHHGALRVVVPPRRSSLMHKKAETRKAHVGSPSAGPKSTRNAMDLPRHLEVGEASGHLAKNTGSCGYNGRYYDGPASEQDDQAGLSQGNWQNSAAKAERQRTLHISLRGKSHVSLEEHEGFSLGRSHRRRGVARDWSTQRKRFVASVACISTAMIGVLIGIYAGLVPSIQYYIVDLDHYAVLGNVFFYLGLAVSSFFFWPLPLLHGRKPYILTGLVLAMPLLFPQAISVSEIRSPYVSTWRWALLSSRGFMGLALGFANMNFHAILMDLFGASLMSCNPHQELVDSFDVRRHGGGMGVWLGIWTWCFIGSLGVGFLIGAAIINTLNPSWGFYVSIIIIAVALLLNVLCPEVRRSAYRRSVAEVRTGGNISRRLARGEVMMHRVKTGPRWWGEEAYHGTLLSLEMMKQPGFAVMAIYAAWTYCQCVLVIVLLGSLASRYYRLQSTLVGVCVSGVAIGALVGVPFQKANVFSRTRRHQEGLNKLALDKTLTWTSHFLRRLVFTALLPLVGIGYAIASGGRPTPLAIPAVLAAAIGFLSCLAISECNGLIMETFDCSDLQTGMTGGHRSRLGGGKRTNYSSFPRVASGFAICHSLSFILAAGATWIGGTVQRNLGQRAATGVVAGILVILTLLLSAVLVRFRRVQIIPRSKVPQMEEWVSVRRQSFSRRSAASPGQDERARTRDAASALEDAEPWRPLVVGNPMHKTRRLNVLEMGSMTRWSEIRRKNHLVDARVDLNRQAIQEAIEAAERTMGLGGAPNPDAQPSLSSPGSGVSPLTSATDHRQYYRVARDRAFSWNEGATSRPIGDVDEDEADGDGSDLDEEGEDGVGGEVEVEVEDEDEHQQPRAYQRSRT